MAEMSAIMIGTATPYIFLAVRDFHDEDVGAIEAGQYVCYDETAAIHAVEPTYLAAVQAQVAYGKKLQNSSDDIMVWPDGTWCYRRDLESMTHMSDDYAVLHESSKSYYVFLDRVQP
jgi:hypothetical protein